MKSPDLPDQTLETLKSLAVYQYLTAAQLVEVGVSKSVPSLRNNTLRPLINSKPPLIMLHDLGKIAGGGRYPYLYFLSEAGAKLVEAHLRYPGGKICFPKSEVRFKFDALHRISFIDFHIAFKNWLKTTDVELEFFDCYFETIKTTWRQRGRPESKTGIRGGEDYIEPDGVFMFQAKGKKRLCLVEYHRTTAPNEIIKKLNLFLKVMSSGLPSQKYQHDKANFVLSVHENATTMRTTMYRLLTVEGFTNFLPLFHFNTLAQVKKEFAVGWMLANSNQSTLFAP